MQDHKKVCWRLALRSPIDKAFAMLATDEGREAFWAETSRQDGNSLHLTFSMGVQTEATITACDAPERFELDYFGAPTSFHLERHDGATLLTLEADVPEDDFIDVHAGWVSVLMALKAACDLDIDLRNHDRELSWEAGFVDN